MGQWRSLMANIVNSIFSINETQTDELLASILARPTKDLANKLNALDLKISQVAQIVPDKGEKGDKGDKGDTGEKGQDGVKGRDGLNGLNGKNGKDGLDGLNGKDGVSIVDVDIALDNHLVITLSDGSEIDAGALYSGEGKDNFFLSTGPQSTSDGGGTTAVKGTALIDFGSRSTDVALTVSSVDITSNNLVQVWVSPLETVSNTPDNHWVDDIHVVAGNIQSGVGFTIYASCKTGFAHGVYNVSWIYN